MKAAIIGLQGAGKKTVFEALTQQFADTGQKAEARIGTISVPDSRVDELSRMYQPRKTIHAQVEYLLPTMFAGQAEYVGEQPVWTQVRDSDALIHVVRNFSSYGAEAPTAASDFNQLDQELILADLVVVEKRLERLGLDKRRGKAIDAEEHALLEDCQCHLEAETPLRRFPEIAAAPQLRGFALLSAKPMLVLFNNDDDTQELPAIDPLTSSEACTVIRGKLEQELAQMSPEEAAEFLAEFDIGQSARDRVIAQSYELLGLISFFTVGEDEVRAWTIKTGTPAVEAAGVIHSDMQKGFIRAEVLPYAALMETGSFAAARKQGTVRLEGKTYIVEDGDIFHVRFNI